jgi:predicted amidophosphoribosyltransferase
MELLHAVIAGLVPPVCAACGRSCPRERVICAHCERRLSAAKPLLGIGPAGIDRAWSSAAHEGVARDLVVALKFRRLLPVAGLIADRIHWLVPGELLSGEVVPVPTAPLRSMRRGFDPAAEIAAGLAARAGLPLAACLVRRGWGRQVGKSRAERIGRAPSVEVTQAAPRSVLLVDDVLTTGATLSACAQALRAGGAIRVTAITFARRL